MSGWGSMVSDEERTQTILTDHQPALTRLYDHAWRTYGIHRFGQSYKQGYLRAQRDTISWVLAQLIRGFDNLTNAEVITELRKGDTSLYWPLVMDEDGEPRKVSLLCDHCRTRQNFDREGICPACGTDID